MTAPVPAPIAAPAVAAPVPAPDVPAPEPVTTPPRGRNSRALPPLFAQEEPASGRSRTAWFVAVLFALVLLVLGVGYWVLKDRFLPTPVVQPVEPEKLPVSAPPVVRVEPPPVAVVEPPVQVPVQAPVTLPAVSVPDWSASAVQPKAAEPVVKPPVVAPPVPPVVAASAALPPTPPRPPATATAAPRPRPKPATPPAEAKPVALSPRETCNARSSGSMANCMRRVCGSGALADHPQCVELRRDEEW